MVTAIDAVLLTHAHRDAAGGIALLRRWWTAHGGEPLPLYAHADTIAAVRRRHARLDHLLRIDQAVPELCRWPVERIVLTQIGRTAPPHDRLIREVAALCSRAEPGFDGMELEV